MLHANMRCVLSELMLHTNMWYVRTNVTNKRMIIVSDITLPTEMKCVLSERMVYTKNFTSAFMLHRKYEVFSPKWCHIRQWYISEPMFHINMRCILSELILRTKMWYVRKYVTHENMMSYVIYKNVYCPNPCYTRKYNVSCPNLYYIRQKV